MIDTAHWFLFSGNKLLVQDAAVPYYTADQPPVAIVHRHEIGQVGAAVCYAAAVVPDTIAPDGMQFASLRQLYGCLSDEQFWLAARAVQIVDWDRTHQFCGRCGTHTETGANEHVKICPACGQRNYPRLAPAVIVAVTDGDKLLLASNVRYRNQEMYSVLAGFVEPGETLEQTVKREIKEEAGIDVENIRYFGSQPWPFPHSLMVAFTADYAGGDLVLQEDELRAADWFTADNLPTTPTPPSIAYDLIQAFVQQHQ